MLIGIDASRANRPYKTGTEWYSYYLIKNLAEIDADNQYILYTDTPLTPELDRIVTAHPNFQARILHWPFHFFWTLGRLSLEMLFQPPQILFVPAHSLPLICPKKTITTIHDIAFTREVAVYEQPDVPIEGRWLRQLLVFLLKHYMFIKTGRFRYSPTDYLIWSTKWALKKASRIITVSEFTKQEILAIYQSRHLNPDKIAVVYNGYPHETYQKITDTHLINLVRERYGLTSPYLLYVGRLEKKKNIPTLIEAFAIYREQQPESKIKLVLIGQAGFGYDEIKYIIEEYNLVEQVLILGWVKEIDLPLIYNGAQAFVFPSRHEGFGIPVIQSLACGLPTIVSDLPVLREVAQDAVLYFDKDNRLDIALKIQQILTDDNLRAALVARGYQRVKTFDWRKCAEETLREIKKL